MALGAFRKEARAVLIESATVRRAVQGYVLPEISSGRYHYLKDQFTSGGDLSGDAPDEGPSGNTWTSSNFTKSGVLAQASGVGTAATASIDSGASDGYISMLINANANSATAFLGFRMTSSSWTAGSGPTSGFAVGVSVAVSGLLNIVLYEDGTVVGSASAGTYLTASQIPVEVRLSGSAIQVWHNGTRVINHTSTNHQSATIVGVGMDAGGAAAPTIDDLFFASVPTCPLGVAYDGNGGLYTSTTATLDCGVAAGAQLPLHLRWAKLGAPVSTGANQVHVGITDDAQGVIRSPVASASIAGIDNGYFGPGTWNIFATSNGVSGSASRVGTFRLRARMTQNAGVSTTQWSIDSENLTTLNASTPVVTTQDFGRGFASVPVAVSSVQKPSTTQKYADSSTLGLTLATEPWRLAAVPTIATSGTGLTGRSAAGGNWSSGVSSRTDLVNTVYGSLLRKSVDIATTASTTLTDASITPANTPIGTLVVGYFIPAGTTVTVTGTGSCTVSATLSVGTGSVFYYSAGVLYGTTSGLRLLTTMPVASADINSETAILLNGSAPSGFTLTTSPTNEAGFTKLDSVTNTAYNVNAWLTIQKYMQLGTTTINTPPDGITDTIYNVLAKLPSDVGEITHRVKDFSGAGLANSAVAFTAGSVTLTDANRLVTALSRAGNTLDTQTLGGALGWLVGSGGLGGTSANFLAWANGNPGGAWIYEYTISTANALGLASPPFDTFGNNAQRPQLQAAFYINQITSSDAHMQAGKEVLIAAALTNIDTRLREQPASVTFWATRRSAGGVLQYLLSTTDDTEAAWADWGPTTAFVEHTMTPTADTTIYTLSIAATGGWTRDVVGRVKIVFEGVPYTAIIAREVTGSDNQHDGYAAILDPITGSLHLA